jgi:CubicO group peptidase (beta-lactamase class C family)
MNKALLVLFCFVLLSCKAEDVQEGPHEQQQTQSHHQFSADLSLLMTYFHIPGLAVAVIDKDKVILEQYLGHADLEAHLAVTSETRFPIASLTKMFTAVVMLQLAAEGALSLDAPVHRYLDFEGLAQSITLGHLLSHTSQGAPGKQFYYSGRFSWLTQIIEKVTGEPFDAVVRQRILIPMRMSCDFLPDDDGIAIKGPIAKPYVYMGEVSPGEIEYGYSASAGLVCSLSDLVKLDHALRQNLLLDESQTRQMTQSFYPGSPYGLGIFTQEVFGKRVLWGYGQYDAYSSLYMQLPEDDLSVVILANNNLMSDPARLIFGDIRYSLFAISVLNNFVLNRHDMFLIEDATELQAAQSMDKHPIYLSKLIAQSLAESYLTQADPERFGNSLVLMNAAIAIQSDLVEHQNLSVLHNLMQLKTIPGYLDLEPIHEYDSDILAMGKTLLNAHQQNPYANYYLGNFHQVNGDMTQSTFYFEQVIDAENFQSHWYTREANQILKDMDP